jgi:putative ABC transport system substrate-binding protein
LAIQLNLTKNGSRPGGINPVRRREFITLMGGAIAMWPSVVGSQQPERIRRVAVLTPFSEEDGIERDDVVAFTQDFQRLGWEEGRNFHLEYRAAGRDAQRLRSAAANLLRSQPEIILVMSSAALRAVLAETDTIPIVFVGITAPVGQGFVTNLAHPGGNVTGFSVFAYSIGSKWLQLLKDVSPGLRHVAVMFDRETTPGSWLPLIKSIAAASGLELNETAVRDDTEIDNAIYTLKTASDGGMIVLPSSFTMAHRRRIIDFAARYRLPAVYWDSRFVKNGGLISYASNLDEQVRHGAAYVDRILKGEKPGDLPVQETTKFDLAINLKTAKAIGLQMPPTLLAIADEVIE